jgi:hypothetical protein
MYFITIGKELQMDQNQHSKKEAKKRSAEDWAATLLLPEKATLTTHVTLEASALPTNVGVGGFDL